MQLDEMIQNVLRESWTDYVMHLDHGDDLSLARVGGIPVASHDDYYFYDANGNELAEAQSVDTGDNFEYDWALFVSTRYCVEVIQPDGVACDPSPGIRDN